MAAPAATLASTADAYVQTAPTIGAWLVISPLVFALLCSAILLLFRERAKLQATLAIIGLAILVVLHVALLITVWNFGIQTMTMGRWLPPFGISFTADLAGALLALTGSIIGFLSGIFALSDIDQPRRRYGYYPMLLMLMAGSSGAFLTGDVFNLYVWFEVLLIAAFGLMVLGSEKRQLDGTLKYAVLNLIATTLFLVTTGLVYASFGTLNMADLAQKAAAPDQMAPVLTLASLYLVALGIKSAAFPVNAWLPASYHTPNMTVAALFAGLLTKIGVYALLRIDFMVFAGQGEALSASVSVIAGFTMLFGALGALAQDDIRRMAGYLVIAGIGSMLAGLSVNTAPSIAGTIFYAVHSMLAMTALFWVCGLAGRSGGSFSLNQLFGIYARDPLFAGLSLIVFLAVAGVPPISGFWPKVMLVKSALDIGGWWLTFVLLLTGLLSLITLGRVFAFGFWRSSLPNAPETARKSAAVVPVHVRLPGSAMIPLAALVTLMMMIGLYPEPLVQLSQHAAASIIDSSSYIDAVFPNGGPK